MNASPVGIDIEQFLRDPYATGIQRVLQYLAKEWQSDLSARFVVPIPRVDDAFVCLEPQDAAELLSLPFELTDTRSKLRSHVEQWVTEHANDVHSTGDLHESFNAWLLPVVSYLPSVVNRFEEFRAHARTIMIGYDILPMTEPANYRFAPGQSAWVSEYFRMLAMADAVVCISDFAKRGIIERLRRPPEAATIVAHPGGDHIPISNGRPPERTTFIRVGTMEARKMPVEILGAFTTAVDQGLQADLVYVGAPSASDTQINGEILAAIDAGYPIRWIQSATDREVHNLIQHSSAFLSLGVEGYGIPVLEAIRLGTPVLYAGEQPAATLMDGKGARELTVGADLSSVFSISLESVGVCLDPHEVPKWTEFSQAVARSTSSSQDWSHVE